MKRHKSELVDPKTDNQSALQTAIQDSCFVIASGPAGTGKTFIAVNTILHLFGRDSNYRKIVIARPNVPTGPSLGAFPGTPEEKLGSWLSPLISNMNDCIGKGNVTNLVKAEVIALQPIETIRGQSFEDSLVIIDEAQNLTKSELIAVSTRLGDNSKIVLTGDGDQTDMRDGGFQWLIDFVKRHKLRNSSVIEFGIDDIVRSDFVGDFVRSLAKERKRA
jgi:phosphate starvation-inducible PhoH-like protein